MEINTDIALDVVASDIETQSVKSDASRPPSEMGETTVSKFRSGDQIKCLWKGKPYDAEVVEKKFDEQWLYYIHYCDFNRRLEEWVTEDRIQIDSVRQKKEKEKDRREKKSGVRKRGRQSETEEAMKKMKVAGSGALITEDEELEKHAGFVRNVEKIIFGGKIDVMYICEFCLKAMESEYAFIRHAKCPWKCPPGNEIYRSHYDHLGDISVFEVDGRKMHEYCQKLCLIAKLFLDHKNLQYDTEPFLFYVFCKVDDRGCHMIGYYSCEKDKLSTHNLACFMVLPSWQRKSVGKLIISFSYALSMREGKRGTPEKPFSDLGFRSYHKYWKEVIIDILMKHVGKGISIQEISLMTGMLVEDIVSTLNDDLRSFRYLQGGKHALCITEEMAKTWEESRDKMIVIHDSQLKWTPFRETRGK